MFSILCGSLIMSALLHFLFYQMTIWCFQTSSFVLWTFLHKRNRYYIRRKINNRPVCETKEKKHFFVFEAFLWIRLSDGGTNFVELVTYSIFCTRKFQSFFKIVFKDFNRYTLRRWDMKLELSRIFFQPDCYIVSDENLSTR